MAREKKFDGKKISDKGSPAAKRLVNSRGKSPSFLIVCEGKETEPLYFRGFPLSITVEVVGTGKNPKTLVDKTIEYMKKAQQAQQPYTQIWVVFDRDSFEIDDIHNAFSLAKKNGFYVAFSNLKFELWYLLHFRYMSSAIQGGDYDGKLSEDLGKPYKKNIATMYLDLKLLQPAAIRNAKRLLESYNGTDPVNNNPSTTVHDLVESLNKYLS